MEALLSCLNLKHDDGFLPYNMPEAFDKTEHGLTYIRISCAEFKPVLHPEPRVIWAERYIHLLSTRLQLNALHHGWRGCQRSL